MKQQLRKLILSEMTAIEYGNRLDEALDNAIHIGKVKFVKYLLSKYTNLDIEVNPAVERIVFKLEHPNYEHI